jgi:hypothetical protein
MPEDIQFYPYTPGEKLFLHRPDNLAACSYKCGSCGQGTNGRVLATMKRERDKATIHWTVCTCPKREPAILIECWGNLFSQHPAPRDFHAGENWPAELAQLYEEGAKSFAAGAYTASSMLSRKILMVCACERGDSDGKKFVEYVDFITQTVLSFAPARTAIDAIRTIGNDANHDVAFVTQDDARRALSIVTYMLNTIYSLPSG